MSLCYRYRGGNEGLQCSSFICNYNISKYPEKEKSAVIMHSHLSEFNYDAGTAMSRYIINSTCVTTKLRQNFKVTTFLSAFYAVLRSMTMMCQLGKATESAILFISHAIVFALKR